MKTRIKPCEKCGGPIGPIFYIVKVAGAVVNYDAVNRLGGITQYLQGHEKLAAMFVPDETLEEIIQGNDANKWPERVLCHLCTYKMPFLIDMLFEDEEKT